jgi:hypothetical protein
MYQSIKLVDMQNRIDDLQAELLANDDPEHEDYLLSVLRKAQNDLKSRLEAIKSRQGK